MRKDMEDQVMQSEAQIAQLRKKNNDVVNDLNDQLDQLAKNKSKYVYFYWNNLIYLSEEYFRDIFVLWMLITKILQILVDFCVISARGPNSTKSCVSVYSVPEVLLMCISYALL